MTEDSVLETLRRVPDHIILATMGRDLQMSRATHCLCGWFMRQQLGLPRVVIGRRLRVQTEPLSGPSKERTTP